MIRTGETVVVPMRRTLILFGMSDPVTKTTRSSTFWLRSEVWLASGSPNMVAADIPVATRIASVLTTERYSRAFVL